MPDGARLAPDELARSQPDRMPNLSREGSAQVRRTAQEIEQAVLNKHPRFLSHFVAQVVGRGTA